MVSAGSLDVSTGRVGCGVAVVIGVRVGLLTATCSLGSLRRGVDCLLGGFAVEVDGLISTLGGCGEGVVFAGSRRLRSLPLRRSRGGVVVSVRATSRGGVRVTSGSLGLSLLATRMGVGLADGVGRAGVGVGVGRTGDGVTTATLAGVAVGRASGVGVLEAVRALSAARSA